MKPFRLPIACLLLLLPFLMLAASPYVAIEQRLTPEQMHTTGLDTLTPEQLAALNAVLRSEAAQTQADARHAQDTRAPARTQDGAMRDEPGRLIGFTDQPIRSRVKGEVSGWEAGTVFVLDNGQQWKVLKGSLTLRKPLQSPDIVVVPGIAGRWFLQVDEDLPRARVYRID